MEGANPINTLTGRFGSCSSQRQVGELNKINKNWMEDLDELASVVKDLNCSRVNVVPEDDNKAAGP